MPFENQICRFLQLFMDTYKSPQSRKNKLVNLRAAAGTACFEFAASDQEIQEEIDETCFA